MFGTVFQQVTGIFDKRFLLNSFFPSLIFLGLLSTVWYAGQASLVSTVTGWNQQEVTLQTLQIVGFISLVTVLSVFLSTQWGNIFRFYEGYWDFPIIQKLFNLIQNWGQNWYKNRLEKLNDKLIEDPNDPCYKQIYLYYPPRQRPNEVMPTRLGNILKNAELYPKYRYNIDSVLIWPRLFELFPESFVKTIAEARITLDFMLVISALSGVFALTSGVYLLVVRATLWLFLLSFLGGLTVAWLGYLGALQSALNYAEVIKVGFDLYRNELLKQMRLPLPITTEEEKQRWQDLNKLFYRPGMELDYTNDAVEHCQQNDSNFQRISLSLHFTNDTDQ